MPVVSGAPSDQLKVALDRLMPVLSAALGEVITGVNMVILVPVDLLSLGVAVGPPCLPKIIQSDVPKEVKSVGELLAE